MAQVCLPAGCVDAIRVSRVDDCTELPLPGTASGYIFNCFRALELTSNIEDGAETILRNGCGRKCFQTKQCDELTNLTVSFELLNPDYELTNLLTGQSLINDGLENIGWYQQEGLNCAPWVCVELFEQVPDEVCSPDHKYRRLVIPKVRFKLPGSTREDPFRIIPFEGQSSPASLSTWATGPFADSPFDFSVVDPDVQTHFMEFFDSSITETLEGACGFVEVAAFDPPPEAFFSSAYPDMDGAFDEPYSQAYLTMPGPQGSFCGPMGVVYVCSLDKIVFWTNAFTFFDPVGPKPATVDFVTDTGTFLDIPLVDHYTNGSTVSMARVDDASDYGTHISNLTFRDTLGDIICSLDEPYGSWNGAEWLIGDGVCPVTFMVSWDPDTDELTVTADQSFFTGTDFINFVALCSDSVSLPDFTVDGPTQITIPAASTFGCGGTLTHLDFFSGGGVTLQGTWDGSVSMEASDLTVSLFTAQNLVRIVSGNDLSTYQTVDWVTTGGSGTFTRNLPAYNVETVYSAPDVLAINMDPGETLTSLVVKDAGLVVLGSWTGSLILTPADEPNVSGTVVPGGGGQITIYGHYFSTAALGAVDLFKVIMDDLQEFDYYVQGSPNFGLNPPGSVVGVTNDTNISITDAGIVGMNIDQIQVSDVDADYSDGFSINPNVTVT